MFEKHPIKVSYPINTAFLLDDFWSAGRKLVLVNFTTVGPVSCFVYIYQWIYWYKYQPYRLHKKFNAV